MGRRKKPARSGLAVTTTTDSANDPYGLLSSAVYRQLLTSSVWHGDRPEPDVRTLPAVPVVDSTAVIAGWREYGVRLDGSEPFLHGTRVRWTNGTLDAVCAHGLTIEDCMARSHGQTACGIYVLRRRTVPETSQYTITMSFSTEPEPLMKAFTRVVCGGVVQKFTDGYRAQRVRIERVFLIGGKDRLGDSVRVSPAEAERIATAIEARYEAPVEITTTSMLDRLQKEEDEREWLNLAHTSRQFAYPYQNAPRDSLNPRLSAELNQLLSESGN